MEDEGKEFVHDIIRNRGEMVCDGSFKDGNSTSCFKTIGKNVLLASIKYLEEKQIRTHIEQN